MTSTNNMNTSASNSPQEFFQDTTVYPWSLQFIPSETIASESTSLL